MSITERYYQLMGEDCITYLPEQPSGFAIMLVGDWNHYVEGATCYWSEHPRRSKLLKGLQEKGYTLFTSNFPTRHFESNEGFERAMFHYHYVMRKEILNKKIHILAEGFGALIALEWMKKEPEWVRSVVLLDPCIHLPHYLDNHESNRFIQKRMERLRQGGSQVIAPSYVEDTTSVPVLIVESEDKHQPLYELYKTQKELYHGQLQRTYYSRENNFKVLKNLESFYKGYEKVL